jgi:hypothetical protein
MIFFLYVSENMQVVTMSSAASEISYRRAVWALLQDEEGQTAG